MLAAISLLFGVQQLFEVWVWLSLEGGAESASRAAELAFLFFAYLFWLILAPLAAFYVEERPGRRWAFIAVSVFGTAFGLSLFGRLAAIPQ